MLNKASSRACSRELRETATAAAWGRWRDPHEQRAFWVTAASCSRVLCWEWLMNDDSRPCCALVLGSYPQIVVGYHHCDSLLHSARPAFHKRTPVVQGSHTETGFAGAAGPRPPIPADRPPRQAHRSRRHGKKAAIQRATRTRPSSRVGRRSRVDPSRSTHRRSSDHRVRPFGPAPF